jgi:LmbE family N-acetylglucosaminyl deacetylase
MGQRVLAVGAHPDDVEIGSAGLLQRAQASHVLVATSGERGGDSATRAQEARDAAFLARASCTILTHPDTAVNAAELAPDIEAAIRRFKPDLILTTSPRDAHQDHAAVSQATLIAARDWCGTILGYYTPSVAERFAPNWFVSLTDAEMGLKMALAACHKSQNGRPYMAPSYLEAAGRYWAQVTRSSRPFVEPYELLRHREP